jgi:hypothetical protein
MAELRYPIRNYGNGAEPMPRHNIMRGQSIEGIFYNGRTKNVVQARMSKDQSTQNDSEREHALNLARRALEICDEAGLIFAAIHLCAAIKALDEM